MLGKIISKLYRWHTSKLISKTKVKKLTEEDKKRRKFVEDMQGLLGFVTWLNTKGLRNRRERKHFWRNVCEGRGVMEDTLQNLVKLYTKKDTKEIDLDDRIVTEGEIKK